MQLVIGALVVATATFFMLRLLPGDPARTMAGIDASPQAVEKLRERLGLNRPMIDQYTTYMEKAVRLDFGDSFVNGRSVSELIQERVPNTLLLAGLASAIMLIAGVGIGAVAGALTQDGARPRVELGFGAVNGLLASFPEFVTAVLLVFVFAVTLSWLPIAGNAGVESWILPALALAVAPTAALARIVRLETVKVLGADYVRTARSHRLPARLLYLRHALPNLLTAALTVGGLLFAGLLGGSVVVENVFAWPGVGTAVVQAIQTRDYPMIQGAIFVLGMAVLIINTLVDAVLAWLDPRLLSSTQ